MSERKLSANRFEPEKKKNSAFLLVQSILGLDGAMLSTL